MDKIRTIKLFKNYYKEFYVAQTKTVRDKIKKSGTVLMIHKKLWYLCTESTR